MQARLAALPTTVPGFEGERIVYDDNVIANSGADAYTAISYTDVEGDRFDVYIGGALRSDNNFHAPNVCMPTADWESLVHETVPFVAFPVAQKEPRMQRMLMQRGQVQKLVYFWFQAGERLAKDEWAVRGYRLLDILRGKPLPPTIIVVVYIPVVDSVESSDAAARRFLDALGPYLCEVTTSGSPHG
jgi:EpsI family protein